MSDATGSTPPGWYPDPHGSGGQRYWDGTQWTDNVQGGAAAAPAYGAAAGAAAYGASGGDIDPRSGLAYASPGQRFLAYLIDGAVIFVGYIATWILAIVLGAISDALGGLMLLVGYLVVIALSLVMIVLGLGGPLGQTPGKHLMGIKVVGPNPGPIGAGKAFVRWIGYLLDSIICGLPIGFLWILFDKEKRGWHDIIADTRVVVAPPGPKSLGYWFGNFRG